MKVKKSEVITFRTTPEVKKYLESRAEAEDRTPAYIVNQIITDYVKSQTSKQNGTNINIGHKEKD